MRAAFVDKIAVFNFFKYGKRCFIFSLFLVIFSLCYIATQGMNLGADFVGGTVVEFKLKDEKIETNKIKDYLEDKGISGVDINIADGEFIVLKVKLQDNVVRIKETIKDLYGEDKIIFRRIDFLGPQVSKELIKNGIISIALAFVGIMIYMWIRFEFLFGIGGILLLLHDIIIVLGICSIFRLEINFSSIAAILTIIGYSINDSVVIYDKIRSTMKNRKNEIKIEGIINESISSTMKRTCYTSLTTLAAVLALVIFGGSVISSFAWAIFAGTIIGTYSSVMLAPLFLIFNKKLA